MNICDDVFYSRNKMHKHREIEVLFYRPIGRQKMLKCDLGCRHITKETRIIRFLKENKNKELVSSGKVSSELMEYGCNRHL